MKKIIKQYLSEKLLYLSFSIMPESNFKTKFAKFLINNINQAK